MFFEFILNTQPITGSAPNQGGGAEPVLRRIKYFTH